MHSSQAMVIRRRRTIPAEWRTSLSNIIERKKKRKKKNGEYTSGKQPHKWVPKGGEACKEIDKRRQGWKWGRSFGNIKTSVDRERSPQPSSITPS